MFPSIKNSTILLDQSMKAMGLDIVGAVTFGALSKGELDLAIEVGMPNLPPEALKKYLISKRAAQVKLQNEIRQAAVYLGTPGNTIAKYMKMMEDAGQYEKESKTITTSSGATIEFGDGS